MNGAKGMVRIFIDLGVEKEIYDNYGNSPLMDTVKIGHYETAEMLLTAGATPNTYDPRGLSPIWWASKSCWARMVRLLIDFKAELEARDERNLSPLCLAALANRFDVATMLLEAGANPMVLFMHLADPSYRRRWYWWDVDTLESILRVRAFNEMIDLIKSYVPANASTEPWPQAYEPTTGRPYPWPDSAPALPQWVELQAKAAAEAQAAALAAAQAANESAGQAAQAANESGSP